MGNLKQSDVEMHKRDVARLRIKIRDIKAYKLLMEREEEIRLKKLNEMDKHLFFIPEFESTIQEDLKTIDKAFSEYKQYIRIKDKEKQEKSKNQKIDHYEYAKRKLTRISKTLYSLTFKDQPNIVQQILEKKQGYDFQGISKIVNNFHKKRRKLEKHDALKLLKSNNYMSNLEKNSYISLIKNEIVSSLNRKENLRSKSEFVGSVINEYKYPTIKMLEDVVKQHTMIKKQEKDPEMIDHMTNLEIYAQFKEKAKEEIKKDEVEAKIKRDISPIAFIDEYSRRLNFNKINKEFNASIVKFTKSDVESCLRKSDKFNFSTVAETKPVFNESVMNKHSVTERLRKNLQEQKFTTNHMVSKSSTLFAQSFLSDERKPERIIVQPNEIQVRKSLEDLAKFKSELIAKPMRKSESTGRLQMHASQGVINDSLAHNPSSFIKGDSESSKVINEHLNFLKKSPSQILITLDKHKRQEIKYLSKSKELEFPIIRNKNSSPKNTYINYNYSDNRLKLNDLF